VAVEAALKKKYRDIRLRHDMGDFANSLMRGLNIEWYDDGIGGGIPSLEVSFVVTQDLCNGFDTFHGGAQATAVDIFTSILLHTVHPVPSVTTDLHVSCISAAPKGSKVLCVCRADKFGGMLQFSSCDLYRDEAARGDGRVLVAKGLHTKYVVKKRTKGFSGNSNHSQPRSKL